MAINRVLDNVTSGLRQRFTVQVFARAPVPGQVKTRLIPAIGADAAARLQEALTQHALSIAVAAGIGPVELWCSPDASHPAFAHFASRGIGLRDQGTGDVGERMQRALSDALAAGTSAVLIGSDCPSLTADDVRSAALSLQQDVIAAFVPAEDGGYVLIGAKACHPQLFEQVEWGSDRVMETTRQRLHQLGWQWHELGTRWDIDRPQDYERLLREYPHLLKDSA